MEKQITVAASGYFDPLHIGHVQYLNHAATLGDRLVVIVNSSEQAYQKKGYEFMPFEERVEVVRALASVDEVIGCFDEDGSVCQTLAHLQPDIFAKGGDRVKDDIPEAVTCREHGIEIIDGLGQKIQSSSDLVERSQHDELE